LDIESAYSRGRKRCR